MGWLDEIQATVGGGIQKVYDHIEEKTLRDNAVIAQQQTQEQADQAYRDQIARQTWEQFKQLTLRGPVKMGDGQTQLPDPTQPRPR